MSYINLIDCLSDLDKKRIENYIALYGVQIDDFIGLDKWLANWSHANQKLYKLLGNQFIYKIPFDYQRKSDDLWVDMKALIRDSAFKVDYHNFYWDFIKCKEDMTPSQKSFFNQRISPVERDSRLLEIQNKVDKFAFEIYGLKQSDYPPLGKTLY